MNIAWLWHYTESSDSESLRIMNENSAYTIYTRWRTVLGWARCLYSPIRLYLQRRATHRTLMALSEHLLADIGRYRSGNQIAVEIVSRLNHVESTSITKNRITACQCSVLPAVPATRDLQDRLLTFDTHEYAQVRLTGAF